MKKKENAKREREKESVCAWKKNVTAKRERERNAICYELKILKKKSGTPLLDIFFY